VPIRDGRQLFDIEVDRADPVLGQRRAVTQHNGHGLADIAPAVGRDHWLQEALRAGRGQKTQRHARHGPEFFRRNNGTHRCYGKRGTGVDGGDEAVRNGAAQDRRMQHALALQIADELAAAAQKAWILDPLDRTADVTVCSDHGLSAFG
jgi:hypothetical protein